MTTTQNDTHVVDATPDDEVCYYVVIDRDATAALYAQGLSIDAVAARTGLRPETVVRTLRSTGVVLREPDGQP